MEQAPDPRSPPTQSHPISPTLPRDRWLGQMLENLDLEECGCSHPRSIGFRGPHPPQVFCEECLKDLGPIDPEVWSTIDHLIKIGQHYGEATHELTQELRNHPHRRILMVENTTQPIPPIPDPNIIRTIPGNIIYDDSDGAARGDLCAHRWIITDTNEVKCLLCEGIRQLTQAELTIIEHATQAGVQFLRWPERFAAMELAKGTTKRSRRKARRKKGTSKATGGVQQATEVPENYLPVKEAAIILGLPPKTLRKKVRSKFFTGIKVQGRVYVRIPETAILK